MFAHLLSRYWWMILLRGLLSILFGIMVLAWPGISLATFVMLFALFVIADGIGNVITALGGRGGHANWWVLLLVGLAGIAVGILSFLNPAVTAVVLVFYIAFWAIGTGLLTIFAAIRLRSEIEGELWLALGGLLSVIFGVFLVARPGEGVLAVLTLIACYAIVAGVIQLILAFKARGFVNKVKAAFSH